MALKKTVVTPFYGSEEEEEETKSSESLSINTVGPVLAWILLLFIALMIEFVAASGFLGGNSTSGVSGRFASIANFILGTPGEIILPLVIGAAIGADVGSKADSLTKAAKGGLLNGIYASAMYLVGIIVIYEVLIQILPSAAPSVGVLLSSWVVLPIIVCIALAELFAILSHSRKLNG